MIENMNTVRDPGDCLENHPIPGRSSRRLPWPAVAALGPLFLLGACAQESEPSGHDSDCLLVVDYEGRVYARPHGQMLRPVPTGGHQLAKGDRVGCGGGKVDLLSIPSVSEDLAVRTADGAVVVEQSERLPKVVRALYQPPLCATAGTFDLYGQFFDFDGGSWDVTGPPYTMRVLESRGHGRAALYAGAIVTIEVTDQTSPTLDANELDRLSEASELHFRVRCGSEKEFEATEAKYERDLY